MGWFYDKGLPLAGLAPNPAKAAEWWVLHRRALGGDVGVEWWVLHRRALGEVMLR